MLLLVDFKLSRCLRGIHYICEIVFNFLVLTWNWISVRCNKLKWITKYHGRKWRRNNIVYNPFWFDFVVIRSIATGSLKIRHRDWSYLLPCKFLYTFHIHRVMRSLLSLGVNFWLLFPIYFPTLLLCWSHSCCSAFWGAFRRSLNRLSTGDDASLLSTSL